MSLQRPPQTLLNDIAWSFTGVPFSDVAAFSSEVRDYQIDILGTDSWRPDDVVLSYPRILITYFCWRNDEEVNPTVEIMSANGKFFTAADLLFKLHNAVVGELDGIDHHFFEGLELNTPPVAGIPPLYVLEQGS